MLVDTVKENLCVNQIVGQKTDVVIVDGDIIIPDIKPDILNAVNTSGNVCIYKKEVLDGRIRIDGTINANIIYVSDAQESEIRGINTNLDFTQTIEMDSCRENMDLDENVIIKSIESKVVNERKVNLKAVLEIKTRVYVNQNVEIINRVNDIPDVQMLNNDLNINSLLGTGITKAFAKDTVSIDNIDNLAEILKTDIAIVNKDTKVSYNKVLAKADLDVKILYVTEDGRINLANGLIPLMGFIDIQNISEDNLCDTGYELKNLIVKPNTVEEHSVYVEAEIELICRVYEDKKINIIQDLYSPSCDLDFNKREIKTMMGKKNVKDICNIREKIEMSEIGENKLYDVCVFPNITNQENMENRILFEGEIELNFLFASNSMMGLESRVETVPFSHMVDTQAVNSKSDVEYQIDIPMQDFIVMPDGTIETKIDLEFHIRISKGEEINIINEITLEESRSRNIYSMVIYFVKPGDTLWNIAKMFRSTVEDIAKVNNIEDENRIYVGQQLYIPKYINKSREVSA